MAKQRGGQPNNQNAHKHGFYSKHYTSTERQALADLSLADVTDMIDNVRVSTSRFMEAYYASLNELDYASRLAGLRAISLAAGCIASLARLQAFANEKWNVGNERIRVISKEEYEAELAERDQA